MKNRTDSSWENSSKWYDDIVGKSGHFYHKEIILPELKKFFDWKKPNTKVLDVGCGQGIFSREVPSHIEYVGADISPSLIEHAKKYNKDQKKRFFVGDAQDLSFLKEERFSHAICILALQNIANPLAVFQGVSKILEKGGRFIIVLNHPYFRIPRQSSWQVDEGKKLQYRRIDRYYTPMEIPIQMNPSQKEESVKTISFHNPLSSYSLWLKQASFTIELIEEWCSPKTSTGKNATMENRSRKEFPLFMTLVAKKI